MLSKKYKLRYSPLFDKDLNRILDYILFELRNKTAAQKFIDNVEKAIKTRLENPVFFEVYRTLKKRKFDYRRIYVGNYLIFYVVIGNTMIVRRCLYGRRNIKAILK